MNEFWSGESAEKSFLVSPEIVRDMEFLSRLFFDPVVCIKQIRENLMGKSLVEEVDLAIIEVFPIFLDALLKNKYHFPTENISKEFLLLMNTDNELETTKAKATILRDVGVKASTFRQWMIKTCNTYYLNDKLVQKQLEDRIAIINQVYEQT